MWWSRLLFAAALALGGCGFEPALAPTGPASGIVGDILIEAPDTVAEYHLATRLEQRLGRPAAPRYRLAISVRQDVLATGIAPDDVVTRRNVVADVSYSLVDAASGEVVHRGSVENFTGYSATSTTVATEFGREDAVRRLMTLVADRIYAELVATAPEWRE